MQTGPFMGGLLFSLLLFFVFLSLPWSVADWLFQGSALVFLASLLCFPKPSAISCRLVLTWECFWFLCFSLFSFAFCGQLQTGSFMGVLLFSVLLFFLFPSGLRGHLLTGSFMGVLLLSWYLFFVYLSLPRSVADGPFHGSALVFCVFFVS